MRRSGAKVTSLAINKIVSYTDRALPEVKQTIQVKRRKVGRYKSQEKLTRILESIFGLTAEIEKTWSWLLSPKGKRLKVDAYFEELNLAVEFNGKQHSEFPNRFHKTAEDFRYAAMCDEWKRSILRRRGVTVVEFAHTDKLDRRSVMGKLYKLGIISRG